MDKLNVEFLLNEGKLLIHFPDGLPVGKFIDFENLYQVMTEVLIKAEEDADKE